MIKSLFPLWAAVLSMILAQILKPFFHCLKTKKWDLSIARDSGGFPSSHSALVSALSISVGFVEGFTSSLFVVTTAFSIIVIYDAANVRYYSGENIKLTQQIVNDLSKVVNLDSPLYKTKFKEVLGHKWFEVIGGIVLGIFVALTINIFLGG